MMRWCKRKKNELVEVKLQVFIGKVDAQLLKAVDLKVLEPKNVQNAHRVHLCTFEREREREGGREGGRKGERTKLHPRKVDCEKG